MIFNNKFISIAVMKIVPMSLNLDQKVFKADHPFVFAIRNREAVYFVGHVAKL